ncbi:hypothetical protein ABT340_39350 [Streptosporangium sp. NPDC000239]|uniref:hypothetical protein n=1 Tax=Streptosporangium sp. NPDC000239 TaxID=3154248 RepID=UPI00332AE1B1
MPDRTIASSPAATRGRACRYWIAREARRCGTTSGVRPYIAGPRCPRHTPAALAGQPEPGNTLHEHNAFPKEATA